MTERDEGRRGTTDSGGHGRSFENEPGRWRRSLQWSVRCAAALLLVAPASAQLSAEDCRVTVNGQSVQFNADGSFSLANVPVGLVRAEVICELDGVTLYGQSAFFEVLNNGTFTVPAIPLSPTPPPTLERVVARPDLGFLTTMGETTQVRVTGFFSDGTMPELNLMNEGTAYTSSNTEIATVDTSGVVTAVSNGIAFITATNQGVTSTTTVAVSFGDPGTQAEGFVVDENGAFVPNATVRVLQFGVPPVMTDSTGFFCLGCVGSPIPSQLGQFFIEAEATLGGMPQYAVSGPFEPFPEGITDAGVLELSPGDFWISDLDGNWNDAASWSSGVVPNMGVNATIVRPASVTVTHSTGTHAVGAFNCFEDFVMSGGTLSATGGTIGSPGSLRQTNGTFGFVGAVEDLDLLGGTFRADGQVDAIDFDFTGGILGGTGALDVASTFTWSNGDVSGPLRLGSSGLLTLNGTTDVAGGSLVENFGTCRQQTGSLRIGTGTFDNQLGGLFDVQGDLSVFSIGGTPLFRNRGTWQKAQGSGNARITVPFDNQGLVDLRSGTLGIESALTNSGTVNVEAGSRVTLTGAASLNAGTAVTGAGDIRINGGTTTINTPLTITNLVLSAGMLTGSSQLTVPNLLWTNSDVNGLSPLTLSGPSVFAGTVDLSGNGQVVNTSTVAYQSGQQRIGNGTFVNQSGATFDVQGDLSTFSLLGSPLFDNQGTWRKSQGTGSSRMVVPFINAGLVDVQTGNLSLESATTNTGTINVEAGARVTSSNSTSLDAGTAITGAGEIRINGGTTTVNTPLTITNLVLSAGMLTGSSQLTVPNLLWTNSDVNGLSPLTLSGPSVFAGTVDLSGNGQIVNTSTVAYQSGQQRIGNGTFVNQSGATFDVQGDLSTFSLLGSPLFDNQGTWRKSQGTGSSRMVVPFINAGLVDVQTGNLSLESATTNTGTINVEAGARVTSSNSTSLDAGTAITGAGEIRINGGTTTVNTPLTITNLVLSAGMLTGSSQLTVPNLLWTNSDVNGLSPLTLSGPSVFAGTVDLSGNGQIVNTSTVAYQSGQQRIGNGTFVNQSGATFDVQGDLSTFSLLGSPLFDNQGTWRKSQGTGSSRMVVPFINAGQVDIQLGTLSLESTTTNTGNLNLGAGTVLGTSNALDLDAGTTVTGAGDFRINGGTTSVNTPLTVPNLALNGGTLTGTSDLLTPNFSWTNGDVNGLPTLTLSGVSVLNGTTDLFGGSRIENAATVTQQAGNLRIGTATFVNLPGATFDARGNFLISSLGGTPLFDNRGTWRRSLGAGSYRIVTPFLNSGQVDLQIGTLSVESATTNTGNLNLGAGTVLGTSNALDLDAGTTVTGAGDFRINGGTTSVNTPLTIPNLALNGGTLTGTSDLTAPNFSWTNGDVNGLPTLTLSGVATMTGTIDAIGGSRIENAGTCDQIGGSLRLGTAVFENRVGAFFDVQGNHAVRSLGGTPMAENHGTWTKSAGTGVATVFVPFTNDGLVDVQTGRITCTAGYTQTAGTTLLSAAAAEFDTAAIPLALQGGVLAGADGATVLSSVDNDGGDVRPGTSGATGTLSVNGAYDMSGGGALSLELSSTTTFDDLVVGGTATLGGTLNVSLLSGFAPSVGDQFVIVAAGTLSGAFTTTNLPPGLNWDVAYDTVAGTVTIEVLP